MIFYSFSLAKWLQKKKKKKKKIHQSSIFILLLKSVIYSQKFRNCNNMLKDFKNAQFSTVNISPKN